MHPRISRQYIPKKKIIFSLLLSNLTYGYIPYLRERDRWGDPGVDGRIILGWTFSKWDVDVWTGLGWLRMRTGGGRL
jgi:hypothetical protein